MFEQPNVLFRDEAEHDVCQSFAHKSQNTKLAQEAHSHLTRSSRSLLELRQFLSGRWQTACQEGFLQRSRHTVKTRV